MKWLFLLLLAANLAFYLWPDESDDGTATPADLSTSAAVDAPTILLIEEARRQHLYPIVQSVPNSPAPADVAATDGASIGDIDSAAATPDATATTAEAAPAPEPEADTPAVAATATSAPEDIDNAPDVAPTTTNDTPTNRIPVQNSTASAPAPAPANHPNDTPAPAGQPAVTAPPAEALAAAATAAVVVDNEHSDTDSSEPVNTTPPSSPQPQAADRSCFRLGPFEALSTASSAKKKTMALGFSGRLLQVVSHAKHSFLIYLGPYEDPDERLQTMNELFDAGVGDILLGEGTHLNSLIAGSFASRDQASAKIAELEQLGYKPQLSKQKQSTTRFYLDLNAPNSSGSPPLAETLKQHFPDNGLKSAACPAAKH